MHLSSHGVVIYKWDLTKNISLSFLYKNLGSDHNCNQCIALDEDCNLHVAEGMCFFFNIICPLPVPMISVIRVHAVLYQLGYQAFWELVSMWVSNIPIDCIAEVMGLNPIQAWIFFRLLFHKCLKWYYDQKIASFFCSDFQRMFA